MHSVEGHLIDAKLRLALRFEDVSESGAGRWRLERLAPGTIEVTVWGTLPDGAAWVARGRADVAAGDDAELTVTPLR